MTAQPTKYMAEQHHCGCEHGHNHEMSIYEQAFAKYDLELDDEKVAQAVRQLVANHREKVQHAGGSPHFALHY